MGLETRSKKKADREDIILWDFRNILKEIAESCRGKRTYFTDDTLRTIQLLSKIGLMMSMTTTSSNSVFEVRYHSLKFLRHLAYLQTVVRNCGREREKPNMIKTLNIKGGE